MKQVGIQGLNATFRGITLDMGLKIDELNVSSGPADLNVEPPSLTLQQPGKATVVVSSDSVRSLLEKQAPGGMSDFAVSIRDGVLKVTGKARIIVEITVTATCRLVIKNQTQLHVELQDVDLGGAPAKKLLESQLGRVNPLVDANDLPLKIQMDSVELADEKLTIRGQIHGMS